MVPWGERAFGMCSSVTAVGRMMLERRMMAKPRDPRNAQQFPGLTSGYERRNKTPAVLSPSVPFFFPPASAWPLAWSNIENPIKPTKPTQEPARPVLPPRWGLAPRVPTCRMTRGDCEWYHRGMPNKLSAFHVL